MCISMGQSRLLFLCCSLKSKPLLPKNVGALLSLVECSFGIYLIHPVIMNVLYKIFDWQPIAFNPVISIPMFCIVFILPCHLAVWAMKKIPVVRRLVWVDLKCKGVEGKI